MGARLKDWAVLVGRRSCLIVQASRPGLSCSFSASDVGSKFTYFDDKDDRGKPKNVDTDTTPIAVASTPIWFGRIVPPIAVSKDTFRTTVAKFKNPQKLADGGVYDNLGIAALQETNQADSKQGLLLSDAEAQWDWNFESTYALPVGRNVRASELLMARISVMQISCFEKKQQPFALVRISEELAKVKYLKEFDGLTLEGQRCVASLRTDLDKFSAFEVSSH